METVLRKHVLPKSSAYRLASLLAVITIFYNLVEGIISVILGLEDETLSLFGFGLDSFVEVISGIGIWHMVRRLTSGVEGGPDEFEKRALKITGSAFYILTASLTMTAIISLYKGHQPVTTFWGIVVAMISIFTMWALVHYKTKVGRQLNSQAILADANCTKACLYLSAILLLASAGYEITRIGGLDSLGTILIAWFSFKEGREAFEKAKGIECSCNHNEKAEH